jgi:uncharacterized protein
MNLSKINRVTHRDIGYLITGLTIIYALSGLALNHKHDWNPNYIVDTYEFTTTEDLRKEAFNDDAAKKIIASLPGKPEFKTIHYPTGNRITIFIDGGLIHLDAMNGKGVLERISKRPLFYQLNSLHYNPGKWWKYFSDLFCLSLLTVTITGLFIIKGKNGITRRGAVLTLIGIILPLIFLFIYR